MHFKLFPLIPINVGGAHFGQIANEFAGSPHVLRCH